MLSRHIQLIAMVLDRQFASRRSAIGGSREERRVVEGSEKYSRAQRNKDESFARLYSRALPGLQSLRICFRMLGYSKSQEFN